MGTPLAQRWATRDCNFQSLFSFLNEWVPSRTYAPKVEWITVSKLKASKAVNIGVPDLMNAWERLCTEKKNSVNALDVKRLARNHGVTSGKWMIFLSAEAVDAAWQLIANEVVNGKLANDCKVSTAR